MRLLIFGDIHGNLIALEKLFEIEKNNFDSFVCHGDIVNYGPWTNECLDFLSRKKESNFFLKGNHEEYYLDGFYPGTNEVAKSFFNFCFPKLDNKHIPFISEFKESYEDQKFHIMHTFDNKYIFQDTKINGSEFEDNMIIGHSHQQYHRTINNKNLYNTGSLGQNRTLLNLANYLIADTITGNVEMKSFIFDIKKVISEMQAQNYPEICINYYKSKKIINE